MRLCRFFCGLLFACAAGFAHADIYGYIDEAGNAHFSTEKLDERYQLYLRGEGAFDSNELGAPQSAAPAPNAPSWLTRHPALRKYEPLLEQAAKEYALDLPLLKAVMAAESGFNPGAVSPRGAVGLMQVMPATAQRYGVQADRKKTVEQKLTDPKTNIRLAARYLHDLMRMFSGELALVLASYNAGEGAVQKYRNQVPPYPETRNYVKLVTQFYQIFKPAPKTAAALPLPGRRVTMTLPGRGNLPSTEASTRIPSND
jgi:soluble lytic murein transglycosylase-like protein